MTTESTSTVDETAPMYGVTQLSPDQIVEEKTRLREAASVKLVALGLTQEEAKEVVGL